MAGSTMEGPCLLHRLRSVPDHVQPSILRNAVRHRRVTSISMPSPDNLHARPESLVEVLTSNFSQVLSFRLHLFGLEQEPDCDLDASSLVEALLQNTGSSLAEERYLKMLALARVSRLAHVQSRQLDSSGRNTQQKGAKDAFDPSKLIRVWNNRTDGFAFRCIMKLADGNICGSRFDVIGNAQDHVKSDHEDGYVCQVPGCGIRCTTAQAFARHVQYFHVPSKTIPCPTIWCIAKFKDKRAIGTHLKRKRCRTGGRQRPHHTEPRKPRRQKPSTATVDSDSESRSDS